MSGSRAEDADTIAVQRVRLRELSDRINAESATIERERKLLVADLDIRELMGARSLHIVDVFDVDGKGKTQHPFGRVFYTEGKSLIFYAFDLKAGATFLSGVGGLAAKWKPWQTSALGDWSPRGDA